jgi:hypothetical protein
VLPESSLLSSSSKAEMKNKLSPMVAKLARNSHARFQIGPNVRRVWLKHREATLDAAPLDGTRSDPLRRFFLRSSSYVIGRDTAEPDQEDLEARWSEQQV